jgi:hypothetical protein
MSTVLPDDLVWEEDASRQRHLSELALTAIADGEEALLPESARTHLDACAACATKLGDAAMLSSALGDILRAAPAVATAQAPVPARAKTISVRPRARVPRGMIAIGLALAVLGALPMMLDLPSFVADAGFYATHAVPVLFRSGVSMLRAGVFSAAAPIITFASACVLLVVSAVLMRRFQSVAVTQGVS